VVLIPYLAQSHLLVAVVVGEILFQTQQPEMGYLGVLEAVVDLVYPLIQTVLVVLEIHRLQLLHQIQMQPKVTVVGQDILMPPALME
jgi:hypothetical protein